MDVIAWLLESDPALRWQVLRDLTGPRVIREHAPVGNERHPCVDERSPAEPARDEHVHVLSEPHVIDRLLRAGAETLPRYLELALDLAELLREFAGRYLAPALEHGNAFARA